MSETYFLFRTGEDGVRCELGNGIETENALVELADNARDCGTEIVFCKSWKEFDPENCPDRTTRVLVIRGQVVVPKAVETVTRYKV